MIYETISNSPADTSRLGEQLGNLLRGGEVVELVSDLGGGKTVFIQGLARGLGYPRDITSPTFTISRVYNLPNGKELHHFDFYRLGPGDIVDQELAEVMGDPDVITAIEWAAHSGDTLPPDRVIVEIQSSTDTTRKIKLTGLQLLIGKLK